MKNLIKTIAIGSILISGAALADANQQTAVSMGGSVANTCVLNPLTQIAASGAALAAGTTSTSATVTLNNIADATTAKYNVGNAINLGFTGFCNYAHTIRVQTITGNLKNVTPANNPVATSASFIQSLNYTTNVTWAGLPISLTADGTALKKSPGGLIAGSNNGSGTIAITFVDPAGYETIPMQAGSYTDQLKLQIGLPL